MSEVLRIFDPNTMPLSELTKINQEWNNFSDRHIKKIEVTFEDFIPKSKPLLQGDIYRHTGHYIKRDDSSKFPAHEIGADGILLTKYFGAIDKAVSFGVTVYRRDGLYYKPIII